MINTPVDLQELRRRIYVKAKAEPSWRFWGLYVHVCKMEVLRAAYRLAKKNNGTPGIDGVSFKAVEVAGAERFIEEIREELRSRVQAALLRVGDPVLLAQWTSSIHGRADIIAWEAYRSTLSRDSALYGQVSARIDLLDRQLGV